MACQNFADTSSSTLAYGKQVDCGTQQTSLTAMRFTSSDLQFNAESIQSNEIDPNRNVRDLIRTNTSVSGTIGFELSYSAFDTFIQSVLSSSVSLDGAGTDITNGTTKSYYTFEDKVAGDTDQYTQYTDCEIDTMSLEFSQGSIVTGSMGVIGRASTTAGTSIDVGGYNAAPTNDVYNAVEMIASIQVDDADVGTVQALSVNIANNKREQNAIGVVGAAGIGDGQFVVTGSMTLYFSDNTLYNKFLQDQEFKFDMELDDNSGVVAGNRIRITMPKVKFANIGRPISGNNNDVLLEADFQAIFDQTAGGTIQFNTENFTDI